MARALVGAVLERGRPTSWGVSEETLLASQVVALRRRVAELEAQLAETRTGQEAAATAGGDQSASMQSDEVEDKRGVEPLLAGFAGAQTVQVITELDM